MWLSGCALAFAGEAGAVGGSMGDDSVILRGATAPADSDVAAQQRAALYSTVRGAERVMSRTAAAAKRNRRTDELVVPGRVTPAMMAEWLEAKGVVLVGGGLDASPQAYRRLGDVLAAQGPTVEVEHVLRPVLVVMAGADEVDPYKD